MNVEVLLATMNQNDCSIVEKINTQSDIVVINQSDCDNNKGYVYKDYNVTFISNKERGLSRSRNKALENSTREYCVLADDDIVLVDNYVDIIEEEFKKNTDADIIIFDIDRVKKDGVFNRNLKDGKVKFYRILSFGSIGVVFKRKSILEKNITFNTLFGTGSVYTSGEDTIFITESYKKGLKIYTSSKKIATVYDLTSTWFNGYNDKFFKDKGALLKYIFKRGTFFVCLQFVIRHRNKFKDEKTPMQALKLMLDGAKEFENRRE